MGFSDAGLATVAVLGLLLVVVPFSALFAFIMNALLNLAHDSIHRFMVVFIASLIIVFGFVLVVASLIVSHGKNI